VNHRLAGTGAVTPSGAASGLPSPVAVGAILPAALDERWHRYTEAFTRSQNRPSEKNIHDLRVAARRLIAVSDILESLLPDIPCTRLRKSLRDQVKTFGPLRDIQVQILAARDVVRRFPSFHVVVTVLKVREGILLKQARKRFRGIDLVALERLQSDTHDTAMDCMKDIHGDLAGRILFGALGRAYARVILRKAKALGGTPLQIHEFRIAFKKFRYAAEVLQPLLPGLDARVMAELKKYQTLVGRIHDQDVLIAGVTAIARRHRRANPMQYEQLVEELTLKRNALMTRFTATAQGVETLWRGYQLTH
jgi:CHAD domain-containing protein